MSGILEVAIAGGPYALAAGSDGAMWVTLVHSGWERLSEERRLGRVDYDNGWPCVLERYAQLAA